MHPRRCSSLLLALLLLALSACDSDTSEADTKANDEIVDAAAAETLAETTQAVDECGSDGLCNNDDSCGGGKPGQWDTNTDPDCAACTCNYYSGLCEAAEDGSTEACPCDWDCKDGGEPCGSDGHCDTWCPDSTSTFDPDCASDPPCDLYEVCEPNEKCSVEPCWGDPDCDSEHPAPCMADDHCDSWCPTNVDPDCWYDEDNGKYCDLEDIAFALDALCTMGNEATDPDCPDCACDATPDTCDQSTETGGPCLCDAVCVTTGALCAQDGWCNEACPNDPGTMDIFGDLDCQ